MSSSEMKVFYIFRLICITNCRRDETLESPQYDFSHRKNPKTISLKQCVLFVQIQEIIKSTASE